MAEGQWVDRHSSRQTFIRLGVMAAAGSYFSTVGLGRQSVLIRWILLHTSPVNHPLSTLEALFWTQYENNDSHMGTKCTLTLMMRA